MNQHQLETLSTKYWFIDSTCFEHYYAHLQEYISTSSVQHTQLTALRYTNQTAYKFGHQKAVLINVLLKMGILMLETC
jgi:hypothetical protein